MEMNDSKDLQKYLSPNPFKRIFVNKFLEEIYFYLRKLQPKTILDIGCGEGFVDEFLLSKNSQYQIAGIDISKKAVRAAKKRVPKLSISVADAYNLPFKENTFDLTICTEVLEHMDNPQMVIAEAKRVSKKYCLFSVPNEPLFSLLSLLSGNYVRNLGKHPDHINFWVKKSFTDLIQRYFTKPVIVKISSVWIFVIGEK